MTPVIRMLLIANVAVYGLQQVTADHLIRRFALWPLGDYFLPGAGRVGFEPWQLLTSAFLHDPRSIAHIAFNMFALWSFGTMVERAVGSRRFTWLYFASVISAAIVQLLVVTAMVDEGAGPTIGASGGVFGVLLAFAFLFPHSRVMLIFPPIPMKAWVLVTGYAVIELTSGVFGTSQGVAHFAHLGGMLGAGVVLFVWWRSANRPRRV
ncbi:MAG TPA: rhomboid family intramembrane serine protease [Steroidobacteraceae bacterium]|nr:rhomboid family intramembrane serine protease [Steroidobacteraceae bacterium]